MKISFLGDISLNDNYVELYKQGENPFSEVEPILTQSDYVVGNLECMAKGENGENLLKQPRLTTTVETLNYLKNIHLSVACLAQNHVYDHLEDGFKKTTDFLNNNKIRYFGAGYSNQLAQTPIIIEKNDIKIGLLNYVTEDTNPNLPEDAGIKLNIFKLEKCISDIKLLKGKVNHIALSLHWGGRVEGCMYPDWTQHGISRTLIDHGADLIIGHHSHTLQPYEIYKGKHIYYSLGNFSFADVLVNGKLVELNKKRTNPSIILEVDFKKVSYMVNYTGIINSNSYIKLNRQPNYNLMKQIHSSQALLYKPFFWRLFFFKEKKIYPILAYFFANNRNPIRQLIALNKVSLLKHCGRFIGLKW